MIIITVIGITASESIEAAPPVTSAYNEPQPGAVRILYLYEYDNPYILNALRLDLSFNVTARKNDKFGNFTAELFDVIILDDLPSSEANRALLYKEVAAFRKDGGGIFIIGGPSLTSDTELLRQLGIITESVSTGVIDKAGILRENNSAGGMLGSAIMWNGAPESRHIIPIPRDMYNLSYSFPVSAYYSDPIPGIGNSIPALSVSPDFKIIFTPIWFTGGEYKSSDGVYTEYNKQLKNWFYFNYFIYCSVMLSAGRTPETYPDWPYSPVPHKTEQIIIGIIEFSLIIIAVVSFTAALKRSRAKPQEVYLKEYAEKMRGEMRKLAEKKRKEELERLEKAKQDWEEIGTHRQFSGFLFGMFGSLIFMVPQLILTGYIFARYIMPYPFIGGMYDFAKQLFQALWVLFDMGTSVALAKFFAQYRIDRPEKAVRYVQIFIWFQMLTGCIQTTLVGFLGSFYFPRTHLASQSWLFIMNSFIQFPGWFTVMIFVFQGMQRTDLQLITNIMQVAVFDLLGKYLFIIIFRIIFASNPVYGDAFGALVGYCIGQWLGEFLTFVAGAKLYKNLGFHLGTLFRVDFGREEFKEVMVYGYKFVIGAVLVPAVHMIQAYLLSIWIYNYNAEWGYYSQILMITQIAAIVNLYTQGLMSGISEAHSNDARNLLELNIVQGFKISYYVGFFLNFSLLVILPTFVVGVMGENWAEGAKYIPFLIFRALFEPATWLGDKVFQGTGYTKEMSISWVIEQGSRLALLLTFMNPFVFDMQMWGLLIAWTVSLILKVIYQWTVIRRRICKFGWYPWKTFIGNGIAAVTTALILYAVRILTEVFLGVSAISGLLLFAVGILGMMPLYSFLTGLLGAWDDNTLREFDRASSMVKYVGAAARMLYKTAEVGARRSLFGLHNKFTIKVYQKAVEEAKILTARKKELLM